MIDLKGKYAVVTGAASGIGYAIVRALSEAGALVIGWDLESASASPIDPAGPEISFESVDVESSHAVKHGMQRLLDRYGQIDILINCAGVGGITRTKRLSDEAWSKMLAVHLNGTFFCSREALWAMERQGSGKIVNITSMCGMIGCDCAAHYSAAKGGVIAFTKALAREVAPRGIQVNAIAPGYIETPLLEVLNDQQRSAILAEIPAGRFGTPFEVAALALYMSSSLADFMIGEVISLNGGQAI